jgi:hypothetical protein
LITGIRPLVLGESGAADRESQRTDACRTEFSLEF